ncbi:MAG: hypothetical protein WDN46_24685 [Methylocella sp.]
MAKSFITSAENVEVRGLYEQRVVLAKQIAEMLRNNRWGSDAERLEYLRGQEAKQEAIQRRLREIFRIA